MHLEDLELPDLMDNPVSEVLRDLQALLAEVGFQVLWESQEDPDNLAHLVCVDLMVLQAFLDQEDQVGQLDWLDLMVVYHQIPEFA